MNLFFFFYQDFLSFSEAVTNGQQLILGVQIHSEGNTPADSKTLLFYIPRFKWIQSALQG